MTFLFDLRRGAPLRVLGRQTSPRLVLTNGAREDFQNDRSRFTARILHEFAHLVHMDVRQYYLALAVVRTATMTSLFMTAGVVIVVLASGETISTLFAFLWRIAALFGLSFLALRDFLRSREVFADLRTAQWLGDTAPLRAALATLRADDTALTGRLSKGRCAASHHVPPPLRCFSEPTRPRRAALPHWTTRGRC